MSMPIFRGARLLFRVDPLPRESPRGYLCRVAETHGYCGPLALAQIAGLPTSGLERDDTAKHIAYVLRLDPEEWRGMFYRHVGGRNRFDRRSFYGQLISDDDLNYDRPRICPPCLKESPIWWAVWDLGLVTTCPIHRCQLVSQCPVCKRRLAWQRPSVHKCRCGLDLCTLTAEAAEPDLVAINAAIYRAAGFPPGENAELDLAAGGFPPEMFRLGLGDLLRLVLFVGASREKERLRTKQRPFTATDLAVATEIDRGAVAVLRDWPRPLRELLRNMLPPDVTDLVALNFSKIFGNFYRHLFRVLPRERVRIPARCLREVCSRGLAGPDPRPAPILFVSRAAEFPLGGCKRGRKDSAHDRQADLGSRASGPSRRHISECARGRKPH